MTPMMVMMLDDADDGDDGDDGSIGDDVSVVAHRSVSSSIRHGEEAEGQP